MLEVAALGISLIDLFQAEFMAAFTDHQQPQGMFEARLPVFAQNDAIGTFCDA